MESHARTYYVEGLNLEDERFIWNDKLMFIDAGTESGNIAEAHILFDHPIVNDFEDREKYLKQHFHDQKEGKHILSIFLACYKLSIERMYYPRINHVMSGGHPIKNIEDFRTYKRNNNPFVNCEWKKEPVEDNIRDLKLTIPLFEAVIKHINFNQKKTNPLLVSLPLYQRIDEDLDIENVIDYCTVLESLICENESELKFKFALRTSLLVEMPDMTKKEVFEFLKNVYKIRSNLVHGSDVSLQMFSSEHANTIFYLKNIVEIALVTYIELIDTGLNKKDIIGKLDDTALGLMND